MFWKICKNWNVGNWGFYFSVFLIGKVLDVFVRFLFVSVFNYEEFKEVLYKCFEMIEDGFRKKFRIFKLDGSEIFF